MTVIGTLRTGDRRRGRRWQRRGGLLIGGAIVGMLLLTLAGASGVVAQMEGASGHGMGPGGAGEALMQPHVAVIGTGNAMTPAVRGTLQLVVRQNDMMMSGMEPATPGGLPVLSEENVQPVVDALVGRDVPEEEITVAISASYYGSAFGPGTAQVFVKLDRDGLERLDALVRAATGAANEASLITDFVGINYEAANCDGLIREANRAAAVDAKQRADRVAEAMDLRLGEVVQVTDQSAFSGGAGFGCDSGSSGMMGTSLYYPQYDSATAANVVVYSTLNVAYAIVPEEA